MIGYLEGKNQFIGEKYIILNVNGVGYKIWLSSRVLDMLKENQEANFWIHTVVKENEISLYGFLEKEIHDFFEILIGVNGVGPKTALEILNLPVDVIQGSILTGDVEVLKQVKGIGQKAAERIVVELKNKIGTLITVKVSSSDGQAQNDIISEAILALESLGFTRNEIIKKIRNASAYDSAEELVKWYLEQG